MMETALLALCFRDLIRMSASPIYISLNPSTQSKAYVKEIDVCARGYTKIWTKMNGILNRHLSVYNFCFHFIFK